MNGFELFAILTTATGYAVMVNSRYLKLPTAMGLMLISLFAVGVVLLLDQLGFQASAAVIRILPTGSEFQDFFVNSSLALMLYAAAISVDTGALRRHALPILFFATVGTFLSVILVAIGTWWVARLVGVPISPGIALLFGAIVAPTDPIAVSKVTEKIRGWRTWKAIVTGESLFNDAIALIVFTVVLSTLQGDTTLGDVHFFQIFLSEALIAVGVGLGCVFAVACLYLLIHAENAEGRLLVGIGIASGSFSAAEALGGSGPVAVVTAGICMTWMLQKTPHIKPMPAVMSFWQLVERSLASMFFLLIGLEVITVHWKFGFILIGIGAWVAVFAARVLAVSIGYASLAVLLRLGSAFYFIMPVSLAGVRGALSVALALSLPLVIEGDAGNRPMVLSMTFGAVIIGIIVQSTGLLLAADALNGHRSNRVRFRKPIRSVFLDAREKRRRRHHKS